MKGKWILTTVLDGTVEAEDGWQHRQTDVKELRTDVDQEQLDTTLRHAEYHMMMTIDHGWSREDGEFPMYYVTLCGIK